MHTSILQPGQMPADPVMPSMSSGIWDQCITRPRRRRQTPGTAMEVASTLMVRLLRWWCQVAAAHCWSVMCLDHAVMFDSRSCAGRHPGGLLLSLCNREHCNMETDYSSASRILLPLW